MGKIKHHIYLFTFLLLSCGPQVPDDYTTSDKLPDIYPDYKEVTVPVNMAPLTFEMSHEAEQMVARLTAEGEELVCEGKKIQPSTDDWQQLVARAAGKSIGVEVYARYDGIAFLMVFALVSIKSVIFLFKLFKSKFCHNQFPFDGGSGSSNVILPIRPSRRSVRNVFANLSSSTLPPLITQPRFFPIARNRS